MTTFTPEQEERLREIIREERVISTRGILTPETLLKYMHEVTTAGLRRNLK